MSRYENGVPVRLLDGPKAGTDWTVPSDGGAPPRVLEFVSHDSVPHGDDQAEVTFSLAIYEHVPWVRADGFPGYEQYRYRPGVRADGVPDGFPGYEQYRYRPPRSP